VHFIFISTILSGSSVFQNLLNSFIFKNRKFITISFIIRFYTIIILLFEFKGILLKSSKFSSFSILLLLHFFNVFRFFYEKILIEFLIAEFINSLILYACIEHIFIHFLRFFILRKIKIIMNLLRV